MTTTQDCGCTAPETSVDNTAPHQDAARFVTRLCSLGVAVWTANPGGAAAEVNRPSGWQKLTAEGNQERLADFRLGMALCVTPVVFLRWSMLTLATVVMSTK